MPRKPRILPRPEDKDTERALEVLSERIQELEAHVFYEGNDFSFAVADIVDGHVVAHGLGRKFRGFLVTDNTTTSVITRDTTFAGDPTRFIKLLPVAAGSFKVRIF